MRVYIDMDNTLADFSITTPEPIALERMYEKGYFQNLAPIKGGAEMVGELQEMGHEVYILSACVKSPYCKAEKEMWLLDNFPSIDPENWVFMEVGQVKTDFVNAKGAVLLDDYGRNLRDWQNAGGIACRFDATRKKMRGNVVYELVSFVTFVKFVAESR